MSKKRLILLVIMFLFLLVGMISVYDNTEHSVLMDEKKVANVTLSTLSMMLETKAASGVYEVSSDTSWPTSGYTFNDSLSKCTKGSTLTWDSDNATIVFSGTTADTCYVYFDLIPTIADVCDTEDNLSECIQELYTISGEGSVGLYYFDVAGDYENSSYEYPDYSYRYSGGTDDIFNFICLGSDCSDANNLYRIIGVFDGYVKVMKYEYLSETLAIDSTSGWDSTSLAQYLNGTYLTTLGDYADLIISYTWTVGFFNGSYAETYYIGGLTNETVYDAKIGLVNVAEFGYASDSNNWATSLYSYSVTSDNNWMYGGNTEWALSYNYVSRVGQVYANTINETVNSVYGSTSALGSYYARPAFYLDSDVKYVSGTGTQSDPIIISV